MDKAVWMEKMIKSGGRASVSVFHRNGSRETFIAVVCGGEFSFGCRVGCWSCVDFLWQAQKTCPLWGSEPRIVREVILGSFLSTWQAQYFVHVAEALGGLTSEVILFQQAPYLENLGDVLKPISTCFVSSSCKTTDASASCFVAGTIHFKDLDEKLLKS